LGPTGSPAGPIFLFHASRHKVADDCFTILE